MGNPQETGDPREILACFDALPAVIWAFEGPEHRIVALNRAARVRVGDGREVLGQPARRVISNVVGHQLCEQLDQVYATGAPTVKREWRILLQATGEGTVEDAYFDFALIPRFAQDGSVCGVVAHGVDVTAAVVQRRAAEAGVPEPDERVSGPETEEKLTGERDIAVTLQRVMLPAGLPVLPQVWLAARYLVAGQHAEEAVAAAGDWFDAVPLGGGRVALIVGDVVGRGTAAVAVMGQLRAILSEALLDGVTIPEALCRLNRYASKVKAAMAATACLAVIDPALREIQYGGFGHPAPLVVSGGGKTRFLPVPPSRPLGIAQAPPTLRSARLAPGEVLLLYSDGLVQRSGWSLPDGMEELARMATAALRQSPQAAEPSPAADRVCHLAAEWLPWAGCADDATLLAAELRVEPHRPLALELPAESVWLRAIRRALDEWLHGVGAGGDDIPSVHLAAVEAATNCMEHAYQDTPGWIWLDAVLGDDGRLQVTVTDHGRWRPPVAEPERRGRGLRLMQSLMESVDLKPSDQGTTVTMFRTLQHSTVFSLPLPRPAPVVDFATRVRQGPRLCLVVEGSVDTTTAGALKNRISELSSGGAVPVDVDLGAVTLLASAGVQVLFDCARPAYQGPNLVRLLVPKDCPARFVIELTGLDGVLEVLSDPPLR